MDVSVLSINNRVCSIKNVQIFVFIIKNKKTGFLCIIIRHYYMFINVKQMYTMDVYDVYLV